MPSTSFQWVTDDRGEVGIVITVNGEFLELYGEDLQDLKAMLDGENY